MSPSTVIFVLLVMSATAFLLGRRRSLALADAGGGLQALHSLPAHYGTWAAVLVGLPAVVFLFAWSIAEPVVIERLVIAELPQEIQELGEGERGLFMNDVRNSVNRDIVTGAEPDAVADAVTRYRALQEQSALLRTVLAHHLAGHAGAQPHRAAGAGLSDRLFTDRDPDHRGDRPVGAVRVDPLFPARSGHRVPVRHQLEPANGAAHRPGRRLRRFRRDPAVRRHPADLLYRHAGRRADRADVGHLPGGIQIGRASC